MGTKTITITNEAYDALSKQKRAEESFSETINRITKTTGKLADCYGTWKMDDEEAQELTTNLDAHWHKATEKQRERKQQ